jgi:chromosome segregation ATPase
MADNSMVILTSLRAHINELTAQHASLQARCNALQAQCDSLKQEIESRDKKIEELTNELAQRDVRYKNLQISQRAELDTRQLQENKERFAKLVREIDKCISLLNG